MVVRPGNLYWGLAHHHYFFYTVTPLFSIFLGLGEEIGWRGFLVPQLAKLTTFTWVALISGIIWASGIFP